MSELLTPAAVLRAARELISDEERWCKGTYARDRLGQSVPALHESAASFCVLGAFFVSARGADFDTEDDALALLGEAAGEVSAADINDNPETTHSQILALFDAAIQAAEQAETEAPHA